MSHIFEDSEGAPWPEDIQVLANEIVRDDMFRSSEEDQEQISELMLKVELAVKWAILEGGYYQ